MPAPDDPIPEEQQEEQVVSEASDDGAAQSEPAPAKPAAKKAAGKGKGAGKGQDKPKAAAESKTKAAAGPLDAPVEKWDNDEIKKYLLCDKNGNPTRQSIKLDDIYFDEELKYGQPRELEQEHYNKYYLEMLQGAAPRVPYSEGLLWQKSGVTVQGCQRMQ